MSFEPDKIYLHDPHGYFDAESLGCETVTWSEDRIDENDYEYVRVKNDKVENELENIIKEGVENDYAIHEIVLAVQRLYGKL